MKGRNWIPTLIGGIAVGSWAARRAGFRLDDVAGLFFEEPEVARLTTVAASLGGFTLGPGTSSDRHLQDIQAPGLIGTSLAVLLFNTRHDGKVGFTVRLATSNQHLINHDFTEESDSPRSWHVLTRPAVLRAENNELIFARKSGSEGRVTFSDVAIFYKSNRLTVRKPLVLEG